jgi:hypothetical protein
MITSLPRTWRDWWFLTSDLSPPTSVYSTCLFCNQSLGSNEAVEAFPVGRRLAFDQRRGRLWVVCRKCEKWNLTPLEERWEAIESCEKLFRDTRKRVSTDNIGLARLSEGLELVRIGEPQRPEFAAWRYGDQFGRRRRRAVVLATGIGVVAVAGFAANIYSAIFGTSVFLAGVTGLQGVMSWTQVARMAHRNRRAFGEVRSDDGKDWIVRGRFLAGIRLIPSPVGDGWAIEVPCEAGDTRRRVVVEGAEARRLLAKLAPAIAPHGGSRKEVQAAVGRIEERGDAEQYLRWLARNLKEVRSRRRFRDPVTGGRRNPANAIDTLAWQGVEACLAVEMAVNEENERIALEGELSLLEDAWKEAEEIASIADGLALPHSVESGLLGLQRKHSEKT